MSIEHAGKQALVDGGLSKGDKGRMGAMPGPLLQQLDGIRVQGKLTEIIPPRVKPYTGRGYIHAFDGPSTCAMKDNTMAQPPAPRLPLKVGMLSGR
jgi:hypothetical protein